MAIENYKELTLDIHLQLLSGMPMSVEGVGEIKPLTLREIITYGYSNYIELLNIYTLEKTDFIKEEYLDEVDIPLLDIILGLSDKTFLIYILKSFEFFLQKKLKFSDKKLAIICEEDEDFIIDGENFDEVSNVIRWQNGLTNTMKDKNVKFKNERAKKIFERLNQTKEEVKKAKQEEDGDLDLADIISAIGSKSFSLNKFNVFDLTVYQMYDEFKRLEVIDNYYTSLKAVMAGAKNVNVKHWTTNTKNN